MFSFEPLDWCLYKGKRTDIITENAEQRFVMHFGSEDLDNRFFVVLGQENIRFFYYDDSVIPEGALNADDIKELGCISLTSPKVIGNDILRFPQMSCGSLKNKPTIDNKTKSAFKERFYSFPFWTIDKDDDFKAIVKCCLLSFVFEIEDRNGKLAYSPLYDYVREKLRQSDVYKLLSAKIQYTRHIPRNGFAYNSDEYTYKAGKFADGLMDKRINKVISPRDYPSKNKKTQSWFYNPEAELEALLEQNRRQEAALPKESKIVLEDSLELKIRDFLYTKHAVSQAMTRSIGKNLFWIGQILMAIMSMVIIVAFLNESWFDFTIKKALPALVAVFCYLYLIVSTLYNGNTAKVGSQKEKYIFGSLIVALLLIGLIVFCLFTLTQNKCHLELSVTIVIIILLAVFASGLLNNSNTIGLESGIYALLPRILVAELAAWLTIGIAEDLVKSMLWVKPWWTVLIAAVVVLFLIGVIIVGEVKQHSPYLGLGSILKRVFPILNHSVFFALLFGLVTQIAFYSNLIKNSDVMSNVVFSSYFDDANFYCQNLTDLEQAERQYETFCRTSRLKNMSVTGRGIAKQRIQLDDTTKFESTTSIQQQFNIANLDKTESHDTLLQQIGAIIIELEKLHEDLRINFRLLGDDTLCLMSDKNKPVHSLDACMNHNRTVLSSLPIFLQKELTSVRKNTIKFNNYDTLMNWATVDKKPFGTTGSLFLDSLSQKAAQGHKCSRIIYTMNGEEDKPKPLRIFPILLIFHTLIVLVLAFVTQLIISEKSVTQTF